VFRKADKVRKPGEKSVYQQNRGLQSHTSDREHQLQEQKQKEAQQQTQENEQINENTENEVENE